MPPRKSAASARAYLLWGQEEIRKKEALEALVGELVPPEDRDLDVQYVDPSNPGVTGDSILQAARARAMFSEHRVVIVPNAGRLRHSRHQKTQETLAHGLDTLPDWSTLILVANAEEGDERPRAPFGEKLMAAFKASGKVLQFAPLKTDELARMAVDEAARAGKKLGQPASMLLAQRAGPDSRQVLQEVRKLIDYVGEAKEIRGPHVEELVPPTADDNIYHLFEAMMGGQRARAIGILREVRGGGMPPQVLIQQLARTLRQVAQAKLLAEHRVTPTQEADMLPEEARELLPDESSLYRTNRSEWQRKRLWGQAAGITWDSLHQALDRLAVADAGTKGWEFGIEDADVALELFLVSVCDAVQVAPTGGGRGAPRRWR